MHSKAKGITRDILSHIFDALLVGLAILVVEVLP